MDGFEAEAAGAGGTACAVGGGMVGADAGTACAVGGGMLSIDPNAGSAAALISDDGCDCWLAAVRVVGGLRTGRGA